jgi:hypothetical protein
LGFDEAEDASAGDVAEADEHAAGSVSAIEVDIWVTSVGIGWLRASHPYSIPRTRSQRYLP